MPLRIEQIYADPENVKMALHLLPIQPVTPEEVRRSLDHIREHAPDSEVAHALEDDLYSTILLAIANESCTDPKECARLALTSQDIDFQRLCS